MARDQVKQIIDNRLVTAREADQRACCINLAGAGINDENVKYLIESLAQLNNKIIVLLDLDDNRIGDAGFQQLLQLTNVKKINLDRNDISAAGAVVIKNRPATSKLEQVNLKRNYNFDQEINLTKAAEIDTAQADSFLNQKHVAAPYEEGYFASLVKTVTKTVDSIRGKKPKL